MNTARSTYTLNYSPLQQCKHEQQIQCTFKAELYGIETIWSKVDHEFKSLLLTILPKITF